MKAQLRLSLPLLSIPLFFSPSPAAAATIAGRGVITAGPAALVSSYQQNEQRIFVERASFTFTGSLAGSFTGTLIRTLDMDTLATTEWWRGTCICTLGDRTGLVTLLLNEGVTGRGRIVIVRGKGALTGLHGSGAVRNPGTATRSYVLHYRFVANQRRDRHAP